MYRAFPVGRFRSHTSPNTSPNTSPISPPIFSFSPVLSSPLSPFPSGEGLGVRLGGSLGRSLGRSFANTSPSASPLYKGVPAHLGRCGGIFVSICVFSTGTPFLPFFLFFHFSHQQSPDYSLPFWGGQGMGSFFSSQVGSRTPLGLLVCLFKNFIGD